MREHGEHHPHHRGHGICSRWMLRFLMSFFLVFLCVEPVFSIHEMTVWTFRRLRLLANADYAKAVLLAGPVGTAGLDVKFLTQVGGVNFEAVATPSWPLYWTLLWKDIRLAYQRTDAAGKPLPDGQRLAVFIGSTLYRPIIFDWQLPPIAQYADSKHTAVVSLFGEGPNRKKEYYIVYHKAFKDTLLGLRLVHADVECINPEEFSTLPKQQNGTTVRSADERTPTAATALKAAEVIKDIMAQHPIQSWLLTDIGTNVLLSVEANALNIEATPYFYFWDFRDRKTGLSLADIKKRCLSMEKDILRCLNAYRNSIEVQEEQELTNYFKKNMEIIENLNPAVYDAVMQTVRFAALFRYIKQKNPSAWHAFLAEVKNIELESINVPTVETPTVWGKPESMQLEAMLWDFLVGKRQ